MDLFQLINSSQKTGRVQLIFEDENAVVVFNEGELVKAQYKNSTGKEAFFTLLAKGDGTFTYSSGITAEEKELPVVGGFMGLIMEGMRRMDEKEG